MGWNGSCRAAPAPTAAPREPKKRRGLLALVIIVLGALAAWRFLMPSAPEPKQPSASAAERRIREQAPADASPAKVAPALAPTNAPATPDPVKEVVRPAPVHYSSNCVTRPMDPDDPDAPLVTGVNQEIGSLLSTKLGEEPTPFPYSFQMKNGDDGNDAFLESLKTKVEFREGESASREDFKRKILDSRIELIDQIKEGASFKDSMEEAYKMRVRAYKLRESLIEGLHDIAVEENATRAEMDEQIRKVNQKLAEQGIIEIDYDSLGLEEE